MINATRVHGNILYSPGGHKVAPTGISDIYSHSLWSNVRCSHMHPACSLSCIFKMFGCGKWHANQTGIIGCGSGIHLCLQQSCVVSDVCQGNLVQTCWYKQKSYAVLKVEMFLKWVTDVYSPNLWRYYKISSQICTKGNSSKQCSICL